MVIGGAVKVSDGNVTVDALVIWTRPASSDVPAPGDPPAAPGPELVSVAMVSPHEGDVHGAGRSLLILDNLGPRPRDGQPWYYLTA